MSTNVDKIYVAAPSPWTYKNRAIRDAEGCLLADIYSPFTGDVDVTGRLIAAAPKLLEIVESLAAFMAHSKGIAGWHLNGADAEWGEFEQFCSIEKIN